MNADHYYAIGSSHIVCEDYARSGLLEDGRAYAIVCDGCSSSPDTDVGARILGLEAQKFVTEMGRIPQPKEIALCVREKVIGLGLAPEAMDATLIIALESMDRQFVYVQGWGDGAIVSTVPAHEEEWQLQEWEYDPNYPFYLSYFADSERMAAWKEADLGLTYRLTKPSGKECHKVGRGEGWQTRYQMLTGTLLFVVTDGLSSFEDVTLRRFPVKPEVIAEELVKVKFPKGKFVTKRVRRMLRNFKREGVINTDDFGVAGIARPRGES